jgi:antitoxin VapB
MQRYGSPEGLRYSGDMAMLTKLFMNRGSQAIRLPREFRFDGDTVRIRRAGRGILIEPLFTDVNHWFAELDRLAGGPFMADGRRQPRMPVRG